MTESCNLSEIENEQDRQAQKIAETVQDTGNSNSQVMNSSSHMMPSGNQVVPTIPHSELEQTRLGNSRVVILPKIEGTQEHRSEVIMSSVNEEYLPPEIPSASQTKSIPFYQKVGCNGYHVIMIGLTVVMVVSWVVMGIYS